MPGIIPLFVLVLIFLNLRQSKSFSNKSQREIYLAAVIIWGTIFWAITETLSLFSRLDFSTLFIAWAFFLVTFLVIFSGNFNKKSFSFSISISGLTITEKALLAGTVFICLITLVIALKAPPNTWDSMTYHMSRVEHWIQNKSLLHYPTTIGRQLYNPPFAEMLILNFQILSKSDILANFVQWLMMVSSLLAVSLLAKLFQANRFGQLLASFFAVTISVGILQSTSTQNDYVASFFLSAFVYFLYKSITEPKTNKIFCGLSLGLAWLTKATTYIFSVPFLVWFLYRLICGKKLKEILTLIIIVFLALIINFGHFARNYSVVGSIFGSEKHLKMHSLENKSLNVVTANFICNIAMHLGTTSDKINKTIQDGVYKISNLLGVDLSNPDEGSFNEGFVILNSVQEDVAGNFSHLVVIIACFFLAFLGLKSNGFKQGLAYFMLIIVGLILFSFSVKCYLSNTRLHLPLFILSASFVGIVLGSHKQNKYLVVFIAVWLFASSMPFVLRNSARRFISSKSTVFSKPRIEQYFNHDTTLFKPYYEAVKVIKESQCKQVGLIIQPNSWEYPFFVLLKEASLKDIRLEHILNKYYDIEQNDYPLGDFDPCLILSVNVPTEKSLVTELSPKEYNQFWEDSIIKIYK